MDGESKQPDFRTQDHRQHDRRSGNRSDAESGLQQRNRNRKAGGGRKGVYRFEDQIEHAVCQLVTHQGPKGFPAVGRSELATMPPVEVARTETKVLLCDRMHEGPHLWPNGDEVN